MTTWKKYLEKVYDCRADRFGNRPCDYGYPCEACRTPQAEREFQKFVEAESKREGEE